MKTIKSFSFVIFLLISFTVNSWLSGDGDTYSQNSEISSKFRGILKTGNLFPANHFDDEITFDIWIWVEDNSGIPVNGVAFQVKGGGIFGTMYSGDSDCTNKDGLVGLNDQGYLPPCDWPVIASGNTYTIIPSSGSSYLIVGFGVNGPDYDVVATYNVDTGELTINTVRPGSTAEVINEALPCYFD